MTHPRSHGSLSEPPETGEVGADRWHPLRAGLTNLYYFDQEEFHFHHGSLLLRGNNGAGKSKVLALTLPFLLDGELSPWRVEPDGDRHKRMEWNLLLGGKYDDRLGYSWLEFGRRLADGGAEYLTIGAGLKAVKGKGRPDTWFFVTPKRIGVDFFLVTSGGTPLTRARLTEVLGASQVTETASEYRRMIDSALFGLGAYRYDSLVNLLIQLRQPQLTKRPDQALLSHALTEALPPLDPNVITESAQAFLDLEGDRTDLENLERTRQASSDFLTYYRSYARIAARRKAEAPRLRHSRYETAHTRLAELQAAIGTARDQAEAQRSEAELQLERIAALSDEQQALRESPAMRDASELERLATEARRSATALDQRRTELAEATTEAKAAEEQATSAAKRRESEERACEAVADAACALAAGPVALSRRHTEIVEAAIDDPEQATSNPAFSQARTAIALAISTRREQIDRTRRLRSEADQASRDHRSARSTLDTTEAETATAAARLTAVEDECEGARSSYLDRCANYLEDLRTLPIHDADAQRVLQLAEQFANDLSGPDPLAAEVNSALRAFEAELAGVAAAIKAQQLSISDQVGALQQPIDQLRAGIDRLPPSSPTRPRDRTRAPGAPLWRLVDFVDGVEAGQQAGIESGLEAAGVLDAWVDPDGQLHDGDAFITPGPPAPNSLLTVLRPDSTADYGVSAQVVESLLASIAFNDSPRDAIDTTGSTSVGTAGGYRLGVVSGQFTKPEAEFIGASAREVARAKRLRELEEELAHLTATLRDLDDQAQQLEDRHQAAIAEASRCPDSEALRLVMTRVKVEAEGLARAKQRLQEAVVVEAEARSRAENAASLLAEHAEAIKLPIDDEGLTKVGQQLTEYSVAVERLWGTAKSRVDARQAALQAETTLTAVAARRDRSAAAERKAADALATATRAYETRRALVGVEVEQLERRLSEVAQLTKEAGLAHTRADAAQREAEAAQHRAEGQFEQAQVTLEEITEARDKAVEEFRRFANTGVLGIALPGEQMPERDAPLATTPAVVLARRVEALLSDVPCDDTVWEQSQNRLAERFKELVDTMSRQGNSAGMIPHDDIQVVDIQWAGRSQNVPELIAVLDEDIASRSELLGAREREIFENFLINQVASTLGELIVAAESQVAEMNRELEAKRTTSGLILRLVWRLSSDAPPGLAAVRARLLRQTSDAWSEADRQEVGLFLQEQIRRQRESDSVATFPEQLAEALDYRSWHEFAIQIQQDGHWRSASGPASGGEKVLAASVPLFAAASSHYRSAGNPHAPRMIMLDEAFAGVDDDTRAQYLGLIDRFELDVVMTSEREWACYPDVPGIGICHLTRRSDVEGILVTPWRWDGMQRVRRPRPEPARAPEPVAETSAATADAPSLFDDLDGLGLE